MNSWSEGKTEPLFPALALAIFEGDELVGDTAYQLRWDVKHLIDHEEDAWLLNKFDGYQNVSFATEKSYDDILPDTIEFGTTFDTLEWNDYPTTDVHWPIMSKKMIDTLQSVGEFRHKTIPITMLDKRIAKFVDGKGIPFDTKNHDYMVVQLLEHQDLFDWENSTYKPHPRLEGYIRRITKLQLKTPPQGYPPIFRLIVSPTYLFVSESAKLALEKAAIGGVKFVTLGDVRL